MPKGFHYGHQQTRLYTSERYRVDAKAFKGMIAADLGFYRIGWKSLSDDHRNFELIDTREWGRVMLFEFNNNKHPVPLSIDDRSVSRKLYLICPYCTKQREHLYAMSYGWTCRCCGRLHYPSQSEREEARLERKIRKLRLKIWGADWPDVYNLLESSCWWPKPKWMRRDKFEVNQRKLKELEHKHSLMISELLTLSFSDLKI